MTVISRVFQQLKKGDPITGQMIADLINEHKPARDRMIGMMNRYRVDPVQIWYSPTGSNTIFRRAFEDKTKVNNQINVDHFSNIVNTKTGYFIGEPITYSVNADAANHDIVQKKMNEFLSRIRTVDLDTETAKMASICGYGARLLFINLDGKEDALNVPPWECIFLNDEGDITRPKYALRYYKATELSPSGASSEYIKAEWYDSKSVSFWRQTTVPDPAPGQEDPNVVKPPQGFIPAFIQDPTEPENPKEHLFGACPLIGFPNNAELQGDAEKVLELIDAYDRTVSDQNSEIEQFRMAYLAIYGYTNIDDDFIARLKRTGVLGFADKDDKAEFITKNIDAALIENHLNRIVTEIYALSGIPNLRDESFSGNASGVALKFKIFPMEVKCKMAENKFAAALYQQFTIIGSKWGIEKIQFSPSDITLSFKRNFPLNLLDSAQTAQALTGIVSKETVLSTLPIVKNVPEEMDKIRAEREEQIDLDKVPIDNGGDTHGMQGQRQGQGEEEVDQV